MAAKAQTDSAGAQLSMMRKYVDRTCQNPECDKGKNGKPAVFKGLAVTRYCSDECRFRAQYLRRVERQAS